MALTFTIGGVAFSDLLFSNSRNALSDSVGEAVYDWGQFHPAGVDGIYTVNKGRVGRTLIFRVRYIGSQSTIRTNIASDREAWTGTHVTIIDSYGTTYTRCRLIQGGFIQLAEMMPLGRESKVWQDFEIRFTVDS